MNNEKKIAVEELLESLPIEKLIDAHNLCEKTKHGEDEIFKMSQLDDYFGELCTASEVLNRLSDFRISDDYFKETGHGLESTSDPITWIDISDIANCLLRNTAGEAYDGFWKVYDSEIEEKFEKRLLAKASKRKNIDIDSFEEWYYDNCWLYSFDEDWEDMTSYILQEYLEQ